VADDMQHWLALIRATKDRLNRLEEQKARYGYATPPQIDSEIALARSDMEVYAARLAQGPPPSEEAQERVEGDANILVLSYRVRQVEKQIKDALTAIQAQIAYNNEEAVRWRAREGDIRKQRQQEADARMTRVEEQVQALAERVNTFVEGWRRWFVWIVAGMFVLLVLAFFVFLSIKR